MGVVCVRTLSIMGCPGDGASPSKKGAFVARILLTVPPVTAMELGLLMAPPADGDGTEITNGAAG